MLPSLFDPIRSHEPQIIKTESTRGEEVVSPVGCSGGECPPSQPRLPLEPVEGGLLVAGIPVSTSCKYTLPIAGCLLFFIGTLLSVYGYENPTPEDTAKISSQRANSQVLGPVLLSIGLLALLAGLLVCLLAYWASTREKRVCFHCPIHGDFFPVIPVPVSAVSREQDHCIFCIGGRPPTGHTETPPCPYSQFLSARNSVCSNGSCPAPKPFVIDNSLRCGEYFWPLNASQDIASFPVSRTPSPTPINQVTNIVSQSSSPMVCTTFPEIKVVAPFPNKPFSDQDREDSSSITLCVPSMYAGQSDNSNNHVDGTN